MYKWHKKRTKKGSSKCLQQVNKMLHQPGVISPNVSCFVLCFRYGGWDFGKPLPIDLKMDMFDVPANRTLSKVI